MNEKRRGNTNTQEGEWVYLQYRKHDSCSQDKHHPSKNLSLLWRQQNLWRGSVHLNFTFDWNSPNRDEVLPTIERVDENSDTKCVMLRCDDENFPYLMLNMVEEKDSSDRKSIWDLLGEEKLLYHSHAFDGSSCKKMKRKNAEYDITLISDLHDLKGLSGWTNWMYLMMLVKALEPLLPELSVDKIFVSQICRLEDFGQLTSEKIKSIQRVGSNDQSHYLCLLTNNGVFL